MKKISLFVISMGLGSMVILYSCAGGGEQQSTAPPAEDQGQTETTVSNPEAEMMAKGKEIYNSKCIACHQANGKGLANAFPSLIGSEFLLNTPVLAAAQALNGSEAVPSHGSVKYPAPMPPQVSTKEDAVAAINYVLMKFNDSETRIKVEDLAEITINPR
jgi:nitrite reductase (NO-forming)